MPPARQTGRKKGSSPRPRGGSATKDPGLREQLSRYLDPREVVVLTRDRVQEAVDDAEAAARREALAPYRLDDALLDRAAPGAIALHCLPAHPGEEITEEVLYGSRQRIWDQAENRRHAQKALLELLVG